MAKPTPPSSLSPEEQEAWLKKAQSLSLEQQAAFLKAKEKPLGKANASSDINESAPIAWESGLSGYAGASGGAQQTLAPRSTGTSRPTEATAHSADMVPQATTRGTSAASASAHATGVQAAPSPDPTGTRMGASSAAAGGAGLHDPLVGTATHAAAGAPALHAAHVANAGNAGTGLAGSIAANTGSSSAGVAPNPPLKVSGDLTGSVIEDGALVATGKLTVAGGDKCARQWALGSHMGQYGTLDIDQSGQWHYHLANNTPTVQALGAGHTATEHFIAFVTDADGQTRPVQLAIKLTGTNDAAIVAGVDAGAVTEDHALQATGTLTIHDVDTGEAHFQATDITGQFGALHLDAAGKWTYDLANAAAQKLGAGNTASEVLTVHAADGTAHQITLTVTGTNDAPVLSAQSKPVTEDGVVLQGQMLATDVDSGDTLRFTTATPVPGFTLNADGSYTFDPADHAYQALTAGEHRVLSIPITVTDAAGGTDIRTLQITLTGTNDAPIVGGIDHATGSIAAGRVNIDGQLGVFDIDQGESHFQTQMLRGSYGVLNIAADGHWHYTADASQPAVATMPAGAHLDETFTVLTADGTRHDIVLKIAGNNVPAIFGGVSSGMTLEDAPGTISHQLTVSDPNAGESAFTPVDQAEHYGHFTLAADGSWTYAVDNSNPQVQGLAAGQSLTERITIGSVDGTPTVVTINIVGTNDAPLIGGVATGAVTEDQAVNAAGKLEASGQLSVVDVDAGESHFVAMQAIPGDHGLGSFSIDAAGHWTYSADNSQSAIQQLKAGATPLTDSFTVTTADGTHHTITVSIHGANDAPVLQAQSQSVTEDGSLLNGQMHATDIDAGDTLQFSTPVPMAGFTLLADGSYSFDPKDPAYQSLAAGEQQIVGIPVVVTDSAGATQVQTLQITVTGTNDAPIIGGVDHAIGADGPDGKVRINGQLTVLDVDHGESHFQAQLLRGSYGVLAVDPDGHWHYTADGNQAAVVSLPAGAHLDESFTLLTADGTRHDIQLQIKGADTPAIFGGVSSGMVQEDAPGTITHQLTVHDVDAGESAFTPVDQAEHYGHFTLAADGTWTYAVDNANPKVQALAFGQTLTEHVIVGSVDGTPTVVTINILGTNDVPLIGGVSTGDLTEDANLISGGAKDGFMNTQGRLTIADVDTGQAHFLMQAGIPGDHGFGTFMVMPTGVWMYTADPKQAAIQALKVGDTLTDSFTVTTADGTHHTVTVTIHGANDGPVFTAPQQQTSTEGGAILNGQLAATDVDTGDTLSYATSATVAGFSLNANGSYRFNPKNAAYNSMAEGETQTLSIPVTVTDGSGAHVTQNLQIAITGSNDGPSLTAIAPRTLAEGSSSIQSQLRGSDPDTADHLTYTTSANVDGFTLSADGSYVFDPRASAFDTLGIGQTRQLSIPVTVSDGHGGTASQNILITVTGTNDAPVLTATAQSVVEGGSPFLNRLTATDPDTGDTLTFRAGAPVAGFLLNPDGTYSFDPANPAYNDLAEGQTRVVSIPVSAIDGHGAVTTQTLQITVTGTNDGPLLSAAPQTIAEGSSTPLQGQLRGSDPDTADQLSYSTTATIAGFSLKADGSYTFDASDAAYDRIGLGQSQVLSIPVSVSDGHGGSARQTLHITVTGTNDGPTMIAENHRDAQEGSVVIQGQLRATDPDTGDTLTYRSDNPVAGLVVNPNGSYTFDPNVAAYNHLASGQTEVLSIPVTVSDGHGGTASQSFQITVTGTDDGPSLMATPAQTAAEGGSVLSGQLVATDPDTGDTLQFSTAVPTPGFSILANGHYDFDPANTAYDTLGVGHSVVVSVPVTVTDSQGLSSTQTLQITVTGTNDGPTMRAEPPRTVAENADPIQGQLVLTDPDSGDTLTCSSSARVPGFNLNPDGSYTFNPKHAAYDHLAPGESQVLSIPMTVSDGHGGTATQTLQITVTGSNDGPQLTAQPRTVNEGVPPIQGQLVGTDPDTGDHLSYSSTASIAGFTLSADGSYTFDPANAAYDTLGVGHNQVLSIPVTATDSHGASTTQQLQITITGTNDGPVLVATPGTGIEDGAVVQGRVSATDPDVGDTLRYSTTATVAGFSINPDGTWRLDPTNAAYNHIAAGQTEDVSVAITVTDGHGGTNTQNLHITLTGTNDGPSISAATQTATEDSVVHGQMHATDADTGEHLSFSIATPVDGFTLNADGSYSFDAAGAAYQSLAQGEHRDITIPITVTDAAHATSTQNLVITLTGTDDAPVIGATSTAAASASSGPAMEITTGDALLQVVEGIAASGFESLSYPVVNNSTLGLAAYYFSALHSDKIDPMDDQFFIPADPQAMPSALSKHLFTEYGIVLKGPAGTPDQVIPGTHDDPAHAGRLTMGELINWQSKGAGYSVQFLRPAGGESHFYLVDSDQPSSQLTGNFDSHGKPTVLSAQSQIAALAINSQQHFTFAAQAVAGPAPEVTTGETQEDVHTSVTGTLHAHDVDHGDTLSFSVKGNVHGSYGDFHVDAATGTWTYTLHAGAQALKTGDTQHETFTLVVTDAHGQSVEQVMTMTVKGSDDGSVIAGDLTGAVTEDTALTASGKLSISDADAADHPGFVVHDASNPIHGTYGSLTLDAQGNWHYTLDNSLDAVQKLGVGAPALSDLISVQASDGSVQQIHISVAGTNDAPTVSASTVDLAATAEGTPHTYVEAKLLELVGAKDIDDTLTITSIAVDPQYGSFVRPTGSGGLSQWVFTPAAGAHHDDIPLTLTISDGHVTTTAHAQLDITPSLMTGALTGSAVEDTATTITGDLTSPTAGTALHLGDQTMAGTYGSLDLRDGGHWVYTLHNAAAGVQGLKAGETHTEHFSVQGPGGVAQDIAITVTGTHDAPVISVPTAAQQTISGVTVVSDFTAATDLSAFHAAQAGVATGHRIVGLYMPGSSFNELAGIPMDQRPSTYAAYATSGLSGYQFLTGSGWFENHLTGGAERFKALPPSVRNAWDDGLVVFDDGSVGRLAKVCDDPRSGQHDYIYFNLIQGANAQHGLTQLTGSGTAGSQVEVFEGTTSLGHATVGADGHWAFTVPHALLDGDHLLHTVSGGVQSALMHAQVSSGVATLSVETPSIGSITEDAAQASISGQLSATDADIGDNPMFTAQAATAGHFGSFQIDAQGHWHYTLDNSLAATQALAAGTQRIENFHVEVTTASGEHVSRDVTVTVQGSNDGPAVIAGDTSHAANLGTMAEDAAPRTFTQADLLHLVGATDTDGDTLSISAVQVAAQYGSFAHQPNGDWLFTPAANAHHADIPLTLTVSDGHATTTAHAQLDLTPVTDAASAHLHVVAEQHVMEFHAGLAGAIQHAGSLQTHGDLASLAIEFTVLGSTQVATAGIHGATLVSYAASASDLNTFYIWRPENLTVRVDGHEYETHVNMGSDADSHRWSFLWDGTHGTLDILKDGQSVAHLDNVGQGAHIAGGGKLAFGNDQDSLGGGYSVEDGWHGRMFSATAATGVSGPAALAQHALRDAVHGDALFLDIQEQAGHLVDTTGHHTVESLGGVTTPAVMVDTSIANPAPGALLHLNPSITAPSDPGDHITAVHIGGFVTGTVLDDHHGHTHTVSGPGDAVDIQGWTTADLTAQLPGSVHTNMRIGLEVITTGPDGASQTASTSLPLVLDPHLPAPDAVIGGADSLSTDEDSAVSGVLTVTDPTAAQSHFITQTDTDGHYGKFSLTTDGHWTYTPDNRADGLAAGAHASEQFSITSADGSAHQVTVTLTGANDGATVTATDVAHAADLGTTLEDTPKTFTEADLLRLVGATDAEHDTLHVTSVTVDAATGAFAKQSDGSWVFTPAANFAGSHLPVTLVVNDGQADTTAHASVDVSAVADTPSLSVSLAVVAQTAHTQTSTQLLDEVVIHNPGDAGDVAGMLTCDHVAFSFASGADPHLITGISIGGQDITGSVRYVTTSSGTGIVFDGLDMATFKSGSDITVRFAAGAPHADDLVIAFGFNDIDYTAGGGAMDSTVAYNRESTVATVLQQAPGIDEDTDIPLNIVATSPDADESLSITIAGLPTGATLSAGTAHPDGTWTLAQAELSGLHLTPPADWSGEIHLQVTATSTDGTDTASTTSELRCNVNPVAETPTLTAADVHATEDAGATALGIGLTLHADPSETASIHIEGVPPGATLSAGTHNPDDSWTLTPAQVPGLTITPAAQWAGTMVLTVTATSTEATGQAATSTTSLSVHVDPVVDMTIAVHDLTYVAGAATEFSIPVTLGNTVDSSEALGEFKVYVPDNQWDKKGETGIGQDLVLEPGSHRHYFLVDGAHLSTFHLVPPPGFTGDAHIEIVGSITDGTASSPVDLSFTLSASTPPPPAPSPSADAADAAVTADFTAQTDTLANAGEAFHVDVQPVLTAAGGGDHLDVRISLLPDGSVVSEGVHSETVSATNPGVNISGWHFDALVVTPPADHTENYVFDIKARPADDATAKWSMHEVQVDLHHGAGLPNAVVSGDDRASTDEHGSVSGVLTVSDADTGQAHFNAAAMQGDYGSLNVDEAGHWTYATNDHADALASGEHVADHFGVTTADGTVHQVVIGITGTDDLPVDAHAAAAPVDAYMQLVASAPHDVAVDAAAHTDAALDVYLSAAGVAVDGLQHDAGLAMPPTELLLDMHPADAATGSTHAADATPVDDHALALDTTHLHDLTPLDDPQHHVI